ncbi:hypothetical protein Vi05172_g13078 [Venturia inaequalis]|nr:hypothetical protein Vi05172_g13078 [Venturia inaequalis]
MVLAMLTMLLASANVCVGLATRGLLLLAPTWPPTTSQLHPVLVHPPVVAL